MKTFARRLVELETLALLDAAVVPLAVLRLVVPVPLLVLLGVVAVVL